MPLSPDEIKEMDDFLKEDDQRRSLATTITKKSREYDIPESILTAQVNQESGMNPMAVSPVGAQGLMQIMPKTQKYLGVKNPFDPEESLDAGSRYLKEQYDKYGEWPKALAAYNAGPGNVDKYGGIPPFKETQGYVKNIMAKHDPKSDMIKEMDEFLKEDDERKQTASPAAPQVTKPQAESDFEEMVGQRRDFEPGAGSVLPVTLSEAEKKERQKALGVFGRRALKGATLNLSEPIASGIAAPISSYLLKSDPNLAVLPKEEKSVGNIYGSLREKAKADLERGAREHPGAAMLGEALGIMAPGGAFSNVNKLVSKGVGYLLPSATSLAEVAGGLAPAVKNTPYGVKLLTELGRQGLEGGLSNYLAEAINPEAEATAKDFGLGALIGAGTVPFQVGGEAAYNKIHKLIQSRRLPKLVRSAAESFPILGGIGKELRREKEEKLLETFRNAEELRKSDVATRNAQLLEDFGASESGRREAFDLARGESLKAPSALPKKSREQAFKELKEAAETENLKLSEEYRSEINPIVKKYGNETVSVEGTRRHINQMLDEKGILDERGNILYDQIERVKAPRLKEFLEKLSEYSEDLRANPSIKKLKLIQDELGDLANFESVSRTAQEKMFAKLRETTKGDLFTGLENVSGDPKILGTVKGMREKYAVQRPVLQDLADLTSTDPSTMVAMTKKRLEPSLAKEVIKVRPDMQEHVNELIVQNLVSRASSPKAFEKAIDQFGRENLKEVLTPEYYQDILNAEKEFASTAKKFAKGTKPELERFVPGKMPEKELGRLFKWMERFTDTGTLPRNKILSKIIGKRTPMGYGIGHYGAPLAETIYRHLNK